MEDTGRNMVYKGLKKDDVGVGARGTVASLMGKELLTLRQTQGHRTATKAHIRSRVEVVSVFCQVPSRRSRGHTTPSARHPSHSRCSLTASGEQWGWEERERQLSLSDSEESAELSVPILHGRRPKPKGIVEVVDMRCRNRNIHGARSSSRDGYEKSSINSIADRMMKKLSFSKLDSQSSSSGNSSPISPKRGNQIQHRHVHVQTL